MLLSAYEPARYVCFHCHLGYPLTVAGDGRKVCIWGHVLQGLGPVISWGQPAWSGSGSSWGRGSQNHPSWTPGIGSGTSEFGWNRKFSFITMNVWTHWQQQIIVNYRHMIGWFIFFGISVISGKRKFQSGWVWRALCKFQKESRLLSVIPIHNSVIQSWMLRPNKNVWFRLQPEKKIRVGR